MANKSGIRTSEAYAWVILGILIVGLFATHGARSSFGAYISSWEVEFAASRAMVTSISTMSFLTFAFGQPLVGRLNDHFGKNIVPTVGLFLVAAGLFLASRATQLWQMYLSYGLIFSLGASCTSNAMVSAIVTNWFEEKRGFALGLVSSGAALGSMVLVPATLFVIGHFGWRSTMSALSILVLVVVGPLFLVFLSSRPENRGLLPYGHERAADGGKPVERPAPKPLAGLFRYKAFWLLMVIYFICGFTDVGLIHTHLIPITQEKGFDASYAALAFTLLGGANIVATMTMGGLSDRFSRKKQLAIMYGGRCLAYLFLIALNLPWMILPFAVAAGLVDMSPGAPTTSLIAELLGDYSVGVVLGVIFLGHQLGGAVGSWLPGLLYDMSGSYNSSMVLAAALLLVAVALSLAIPEPPRLRAAGNKV